MRVGKCFLDTMFHLFWQNHTKLAEYFMEYRPTKQDNFYTSFSMIFYHFTVNLLIFKHRLRFLLYTSNNKILHVQCLGQAKCEMRFRLKYFENDVSMTFR